MKKRILTVLAMIVLLATVTVFAVGAETAEATCPHCNVAMDSIEWKPYNAAGIKSTGGHYYLTTDVSRTLQLQIDAGVDSVIDLRDCDFTVTAANIRAFLVYGTLSVMDTTGNGTVTGLRTSSGSTYNVQSGGTLNLYGGTAAAGYAATSGSVVYVQAGGTLNIGGSAILDGSSVTTGSGTRGTVYSEGNIVMSGGEIKGASAGSGGSIYVNAGNLTVSGGKISGGQAANYGDDIFVNNDASVVTITGGEVSGQFHIDAAMRVSISNDPKIGYLYTNADSAPTIGEMTEGASVYLAVVDSLALAEANDQMVTYLEKGYFKAYTGGKVLTTDGSTVTAAAYDCPCCDTAAADIVWTAWTGTVEDGAHYYLSEDLSLTAQITIPAGTSATLDLRGKEITAEAVRGFMVRGNLDIVDSGVTGKVVSGTSGTNGGVFSVQATGTVELHGGTYIANAAPAKGSIAYVLGSMVIHEGVTLDGSNAQDDTTTCGTVYTKGSFTMDGGTIIGGTAKRGGSIFVEAGTLNITGGSIYGGASNTTDGSGDDIYIQAATAVTLADCSVAQEVHINAATTATLSGDVVLTRLKLSDGVLLTLGELTENADVTVAVSNGAFTVANANAAAYLEAEYIKTANANQILVVVDNVIKARDPNAPKCPHCQAYMDEITWEAFDTTKVKENGGHFYLEGTRETSQLQQVGTTTNTTVDTVIDLRGNDYTVTAANKRAFLVYGTLSIMDTVGEGVVTGLGNGNGGVYNVQSGAKLYLYGGTSTAGTDAGHGSVVYLEGAMLTVDGSAVLNGNGKTGSTIYANVKAGNGSTVTIKSGTVRAGLAKGFGGNIYVSDQSRLTISGGTVGGGTADLDGDEKNGLGGNIYLAPGAQATLSAGNVQNGSSASYGGNIAIAAGAQMEITGGFIRTGAANTAGKLTGGMEGDNIYTEGTLTLYKGSFTLEDTNHLGNAILARGAAVVNIHGTVTDYGKAISGNIHMLSTCTLNADFGTQMIYRYSRIGWYRTVAEAIADFGNHENHRYIKLLYAEDITVNKDIYLDVNGLRVNVTVDEGCTLMGMDGSATLEAPGTGCAIVSGEGTVAVEADRGSLGRYVALTRNGETTFHKFELVVTTVSLRPSAMGFYYKAKCTCDPILAAAVDTYGVVLSVNNMPGKDFVTESGDINKYTIMNGDTFVSGQVTTSGSVFGIMKDSLDAATNKARGEIKIYVNAYVNFLTDGVNPQTVVADNSNVGMKDGDEDFDGVGCSLYDIMKMLDEKYADLTAAQQTTVKDFYDTWYGKGMSSWSFVNFRNFYVGFGRSNITPDFNVYISGGNVADRISTDVKDDLYITCVAITDTQGATALLITQDLINSQIGYSTRQKIAEVTGVPFKNIMITATHTHSAPATAGDYQGVAEYQTLYYEAAVAAAKAALADRAPAAAQTGSTTARTENNKQLVFVRRYKQLDGGYRGGVGNNTYSPMISHAYDANETMQVIKFVRSGSKKDILLTNLGAHATFNGATTQTSLSADFPGAIRDYVESNSDCLSAHFISGAADQNPTTELNWEDHGLDYIAYGQAIGKVALGATLTDIETGNIAFTSKVVTVDSNKADVDADTLAKAQQANEVFLASGFAAGEEKAIELGFIGIYHARSFITRSSLEDTQSIGINALAIGDLSFVFAPYEMFGSSAADLIAGSPYQNTFVVTCANDSKGYVPADNAYDMGCYESYVAKVARGSAETLVDEFLVLLNTLHG